jgi:hypothetical protein
MTEPMNARYYLVLSVFRRESLIGGECFRRGLVGSTRCHEGNCTAGSAVLGGSSALWIKHQLM